MRNVVNLGVLLLAVSLPACDKSESFGGGDKAKPAPAPAAATGDKAPAAGDKAGDKTGADPVAKAPPPAPKPPKPAEKTGILDLELQEVDGGWKLVTPRVTQLFSSKPSVQRQDAQTPFGDTIPGGVAIVESGDRFAGLIYIPIPKDLPYDVPKGLKGARDGMLGMFEGKYDAKDEKTKLGPFDANHVIADGMREGHSFHVEAWIAYDPVGHTVYGLMSLRTPTDLEGIGVLRDGFALRDDVKAAGPGLDAVIKSSAKKPAAAKKPGAPKTTEADAL